MNTESRKRVRVRLSSPSGSEVLISAEPCPHSIVLNRVCMLCSEGVNETFGLSFDYIRSGLRYGYLEVSRLKKRNTKNLLKKKKLQLVLDLDQTLLHSRIIKKLSSEEQYLKNQVDSLERISDGNLFHLESMGFLVKLRPYVRRFLEEASSLFEMYVCTMGSRDYALEAAKLLDPDSKYFSSRIIAREDFKQKEKKNLNLVLGQETGVVILDDTDSVWADYSDNLITVRRYKYFKGSEDDDPSYSEKRTDESETNGALVHILGVLKRVHGLYFVKHACKDVRKYLAKIRKEVLRGCTLLFKDSGESLLIWSRAEEMGAICTTVFDSSVTHVVSLYTEPAHCGWVEQDNKFLVNPRWINDAFFLWSRQPEHECFP